MYHRQARRKTTFLEPRDFTMFCHDKLRRDVRDSEGRLTRRLESQGKVDGLDGKVDDPLVAVRFSPVDSGAASA